MNRDTTLDAPSQDDPIFLSDQKTSFDATQFDNGTDGFGDTGDTLYGGDGNGGMSYGDDDVWLYGGDGNGGMSYSDDGVWLDGGDGNGGMSYGSYGDGGDWLYGGDGNGVVYFTTGGIDGGGYGNTGSPYAAGGYGEGGYGYSGYAGDAEPYYGSYEVAYATGGGVVKSADGGEVYKDPTDPDLYYAYDSSTGVTDADNSADGTEVRNGLPGVPQPVDSSAAESVPSGADYHGLSDDPAYAQLIYSFWNGSPMAEDDYLGPLSIP